MNSRSVRCQDRRFAAKGRRGRRTGLSLVELVVVISTLSVLMSFATVLLGLLFRTDHAGQTAMAEQLSISRLSRQFRNDAHRASAASTTEDPAGALELTLSDGTRVTWSAGDAAVSRIVRRDDAIVARDSFTLSEGTTSLSWAAGDGVLELRHGRRRPDVLENAADAVEPQRDVLTIVAAVGIETPTIDRQAPGTAAASSEVP